MRTTSVSFRQYGTTKRTALRRSRSRSATLLLRGGGRSRRLAREHEDVRGEITRQVDRLHVLVGGSVVEIDRLAGVVDVEHLAVGAGAQRHPRPALELGALDHSLRGLVELPELVAADLVEQA